MKLRITRPAVATLKGSVRPFAPGLMVEVDAATAEQILAQQAAIVLDLTAPGEPNDKAVAVVSSPVTLPHQSKRRSRGQDGSA
jgi:hypothetical protein